MSFVSYSSHISSSGLSFVLSGVQHRHSLALLRRTPQPNVGCTDVLGQRTYFGRCVSCSDMLWVVPATHRCHTVRHGTAETDWMGLMSRVNFAKHDIAGFNTFHMRQNDMRCQRMAQSDTREHHTTFFFRGDGIHDKQDTARNVGVLSALYPESLRSHGCRHVSEMCSTQLHET